jgi:glucose-1-phosphate thymidylyltransferase
MKGIILAGDAGTRLHPVTLVFSKQLLPVYDKPMIYYPLTGADNVVLILGDNIFYGHGLPELMANATARAKGATIFGYVVSDPQRYGVLEMDAGGKVLSIEEKPRQPKSNYAVTGLYFYDNQVVEIAAAIRPSERARLSRTRRVACRADGPRLCVARHRHTCVADRGRAVRADHRTAPGLAHRLSEEIAFRLGFISGEQLLAAAKAHDKSGYGQYLRAIYDSEAKGG